MTPLAAGRPATNPGGAVDLRYGRAVPGRVVEIRRFAVKSMQGEVLDAAPIGPLGIEGDRTHAVLDATTGRVASAKHPRQWGRLLDHTAIWLGSAVEITLVDGTTVRSDDPDADRRLTEAIGRPVRLASAPAADAAYEDEWPDIDGVMPDEFIASTQTSTSEDGRPVSTMAVGMMAPGTFQDVAPLTVMTTASLRAASEVAPDSRWDPRRFRPNLLLDLPGEGFLENGWAGRRMHVGEVVIDIAFATPRCVMTTLAQRDLPTDRDVLRAVATHNRVSLPGIGPCACLGAYATVVTPGVVRAGDPVELEAAAPAAPPGPAGP